MENGAHHLSSFGTPIANSTRSLLSPRPGSSSSNHSTGSSSVSSSHRPLVQRLKGQDLYGGPVKFGGGNASTFFKQRRERLHAASPYASKKRIHESRKASDNSSSSLQTETEELISNSTHKGGSHSIAPSDAMSSTAKLILDTLERMSTPLRDARKIPVHPSPDMSRAEKRRLIAEELDSSLLGSPKESGLKRKRPNLSSTGSFLCGPPVRTFFSPVLNRAKKCIPENTNLPGISERKKETPKASIPNGTPVEEELPSIASSIEAFKKTVDSSNRYGETSNASAGGKLRMKDTMGPRSGRLPGPASSGLPVQAPPRLESSSLSNGWTLPSKSPLSAPKPSPPQPMKLPAPPPPVQEKKTTPPPTSLSSIPLFESSFSSKPIPKPDDEVNYVFNFSEPQRSEAPIIDAGIEGEDKNIQFIFSNPKILAEKPKDSDSSTLMLNGHEPLRKLPDITSLPSTTTTLKARGGGLVGSKGLLPDITAVPSQLKKGSVLSALSKMHDPTESKNARL